MKLRAKPALPRIDRAVLWELFRRFSGELRPHRGRLAASALALLAESFVILAQPWPLKFVFDRVLMPADGAAAANPSLVVGLAAGAVLLLAGAKGLLTYVHNVQAKIVGHRLVADVRLRVFSHAQRLPLSYHDYRETGDLMTRLTGDVSLLQDLLVSVVVTMTSRIVLVLGMLGMMFWMDAGLGLLALAVMPLFILAAFRYSGRIKTSARKQREAYGKIVASVQESLAGIAQVKGFAQEKAREKMIGRSSARDLKANVKTTKLTANYTRTVELVSALGTCLVLWFGTRRVMAGTITPGELLIFLSYLRGMHKPLASLARETVRISKAVTRGEKILELLDMEAEVEEPEGAVSARGVRGDIRFLNVNFSYVPGTPVLRDFTCSVPAGRTTVVLGPTGAGKSTLAKLLLRLYEPESGRVLLDGRDVADYRIRSLRKRVAPLLQDAFLFHMSIAENIAFGASDPDMEAIREAARLAGADEFIDRLPDGYDTVVGESGATLSGGQRQRLAVARAILRDAPIMIFDEPTTGLDVRTEMAAKASFASIRADRTLLLITHRLHFLDIADWVVFVHEGRVVDEGEPAELARRCRPYRDFIARETALAVAASAAEVSP